MVNDTATIINIATQRANPDWSFTLELSDSLFLSMALSFIVITLIIHLEESALPLGLAYCTDHAN
jgi:hypothetical protein